MLKALINCEYVDVEVTETPENNEEIIKDETTAMQDFFAELSTVSSFKELRATAQRFIDNT